MKHSGILRGLGLWWLLLSVATVAAAPCDTLRVAFLTDIHVTPGNAQDSLLRIAIDEINASTCDIVLLGGDLTNLGSDAELEHVHALISRLRKPWCAVPGNHETTWSESACTTFARIFGHDGRIAAVREDGTLLWCAKCCQSAANFIVAAPDGSLWTTFAEGKIFRIPPER